MASRAAWRMVEQRFIYVKPNDFVAYGGTRAKSDSPVGALSHQSLRSSPFDPVPAQRWGLVFWESPRCLSLKWVEPTLVVVVPCCICGMGQPGQGGPRRIRLAPYGRLYCTIVNDFKSWKWVLRCEPGVDNERTKTIRYKGMFMFNKCTQAGFSDPTACCGYLPNVHHPS